MFCALLGIARPPRSIIECLFVCEMCLLSQVLFNLGQYGRNGRTA